MILRIYKINWVQLLHSLLPPDLRHYSVRDLVAALLAPAQAIQTDYEARQREWNHLAAYSNQDGSMHYALNDWFRPGHNGIFNQSNNAIYITRNNVLSDIFLFEENISQNDMVFLATEASANPQLFIGSDEDLAQAYLTVHYPLLPGWSASDLSASLSAFLNKFLPIGVSYTLNQY